MTVNANIDAGIRYMKYLTRRFWSMKDVLRAYNWWEWNMSKFIKWRKKKLPSQTKEYTKEIMKKYHALKWMWL